MPKLPEMIGVSDLRNDAAGVLKRLRAARAPTVITQRGKAAAILVSVEEYERAEREREILRILVRGEQEIRRGEGHDLDDVLVDADRLLDDEG